MTWRKLSNHWRVRENTQDARSLDGRISIERNYHRWLYNENKWEFLGISNSWTNPWNEDHTSLIWRLLLPSSRLKCFPAQIQTRNRCHANSTACFDMTHKATSARLEGQWKHTSSKANLSGIDGCIHPPHKNTCGHGDGLQSYKRGSLWRNSPQTYQCTSSSLDSALFQWIGPFLHNSLRILWWAAYHTCGGCS